MEAQQFCREVDDSSLDDPPYRANYSVCVDQRADEDIVFVSGDLDIASCSLVRQACVDGHLTKIIVDISRLDFMDCAGYRALITARQIVELRGGSLVWRGQNGEPARLLDLLSRLDDLTTSDSANQGRWVVRQEV